MKIMRAFQIEQDYQRHRDRLLLIKSLDTRKKVSISTSKNIDKINNYRRVKANSFFGQDLEKDRQIMQKNEHLHRTLLRVYNRDAKNMITQEINHHEHLVLNRTSSYSTVRSHASSRIQQQNRQMVKKLSLAKSSYRKFRQEKPRKRVVTEVGHKKQIIKILESQLGCKPKVLFPTLTTTKKQKQKKKALYFPK